MADRSRNRSPARADPDRDVYPKQIPNSDRRKSRRKTEDPENRYGPESLGEMRNPSHDPEKPEEEKMKTAKNQNRWRSNLARRGK